MSDAGVNLAPRVQVNPQPSLVDGKLTILFAGLLLPFFQFILSRRPYLLDAFTLTPRVITFITMRIPVFYTQSP